MHPALIVIVTLAGVAVIAATAAAVVLARLGARIDAAVEGVHQHSEASACAVGFALGAIERGETVSG